MTAATVGWREKARYLVGNGTTMENGRVRVDAWRVIQLGANAVLVVLLCCLPFLLYSWHAVSQDVEVMKNNRFTAQDGSALERALDVRLDRIQQAIDKLPNADQLPPQWVRDALQRHERELERLRTHQHGGSNAE